MHCYQHPIPSPSHPIPTPRSNCIVYDRIVVFLWIVREIMKPRRCPKKVHMNIALNRSRIAVVRS